MLPPPRAAVPLARRGRVMPLTPTFVLALGLLVSEPAVETKFVQVAPAVKPTLGVRRTPGQARAVILFHGLHPHPIRDANAWKAELSGWEEPDSPMVKALAKD